MTHTKHTQHQSDLEKRLEAVKKFAAQKPVIFFGAVLLAVIVLLQLLSSFGFFGEVREPKVNPAVALEKADSLMWLGMEVAPVNAVVRKEFKLPGKIKGMFVIDEGKELAFKYGIKTADVIVSISRQAVADSKSFLNAANGVQYRDGILLDVYRNGKNSYVTIPFDYQYGPLMGPYKGSWQLGSPLLGKPFGYGQVMQ
ncbi:MAG: PDZ domain-containing protein [Candidatus Omnitrophica bacterium]|nr:PDZ domain-containing protein [Candidatus Omnitrophota bacterium]